MGPEEGDFRSKKGACKPLVIVVTQPISFGVVAQDKGENAAAYTHAVLHVGHGGMGTGMWVWGSTQHA